MDIIRDILKGLVVGGGAVAPGISGGTLAVILNIYSKIISIIASPIQGIKKHFKFCVTIGIGGVLGVLLFSNIMSFLFTNYEVPVKFLFIGLMAGSLPSVIRTANKEGFSKMYILAASLAFAITLLFDFMDGGANTSAIGTKPSFLHLIIYGGVIGFGTIIPGISASFVLINLGVYNQIISSISSIDIMTLIPLGLGFGIAILLFANLIKMLLEKAYGYTHYTIFGFVAGSIILVIPRTEFSLSTVIGLILMVAGYALSYFLSKKDMENT